jgi:hypothetical protein
MISCEESGLFDEGHNLHSTKNSKYESSPTSDIKISRLYFDSKSSTIGIRHLMQKLNLAFDGEDEDADGALTRWSDFGGAKRSKRRQATFKDQIRSVHIHLSSVSTSTYPS